MPRQQLEELQLGGCAYSRRRRLARTTCASCPSRARTTCATPTRSGSFAVPREELRAASTLLRDDRQADRRRATRGRPRRLRRGRRARRSPRPGAEPGMMLHNAYGYGLFTGGLGFHDGGERLGMAVVPVSRRDDRAAADADHGLPARRDRVHAELRAHARAGVRGARRRARTRSASLRDASAPSRGRRRCAREIDARARRARREHLRALGGDRPGRAGECSEERAGLARERGPLPAGGRRSRRAARRCPRARRACSSSRR